MTTFNLSIGKKIKLLRTALDMNQTEFAGRIGVHLLMVHKIENDRREPGQDILDAIKREFEVSPDSIRLTAQ